MSSLSGREYVNIAKNYSQLGVSDTKQDKNKKAWGTYIFYRTLMIFHVLSVLNIFNFVKINETFNLT